MFILFCNCLNYWCVGSLGRSTVYDLNVCQRYGGNFDRIVLPEDARFAYLSLA